MQNQGSREPEDLGDDFCDEDGDDDYEQALQNQGSRESEGMRIMMMRTVTEMTE